MKRSDGTHYAVIQADPETYKQEGDEFVFEVRGGGGDPMTFIRGLYRRAERAARMRNIEYVEGLGM